MAKFTESAIESFAIKLFERLGYIALHDPDIASDGISPEGGDYAEVFHSCPVGWSRRKWSPTSYPKVAESKRGCTTRRMAVFRWHALKANEYAPPSTACS